MKLFERTQLVQAFQLPLWGQTAAETPPQWLVTRIQSGELRINRHGGFTMDSPWGVQDCIAGDIVVFHEDESVSFEKPEKFKANFEPLDIALDIAA